VPVELRHRPGAASAAKSPRSVHHDEEQPEMSLFQRAHEIVQAKANKALDAAEKPDEMLDLSYEQMLDQLTQVRRGLVDIAAARKQIELQEQQLQHSADHLQDQAKAALAQAGRIWRGRLFPARPPPKPRSTRWSPSTSNSLSRSKSLSRPSPRCRRG
jgi:small-conductance mechanosensitive channel